MEDQDSPSNGSFEITNWSLVLGDGLIRVTDLTESSPWFQLVIAFPDCRVHGQ